MPNGPMWPLGISLLEADIGALATAITSPNDNVRHWIRGEARTASSITIQSTSKSWNCFKPPAPPASRVANRIHSVATWFRGPTISGITSLDTRMLKGKWGSAG